MFVYLCMYLLCIHFVVVSRDNVLALVRLVFTTLSDAMEDNPANRRHFDNNVSKLHTLGVAGRHNTALLHLKMSSAWLRNDKHVFADKETFSLFIS